MAPAYSRVASHGCHAGDLVTAAEELREAGAERVGLTSGPGGVVLAGPAGILIAEPPAIEAISTVGAG
jgi:fructose-1-phosphate kinase PfkB-like protein